jgi:hypothetical protein
MSAARTKRFMRFMKAHPGCRLCALSGTMTTRSLKDYAHLLDLALRHNSPVPSPQNYSSLMEWAEAVDVWRPGSPSATKDNNWSGPRSAGVLVEFMNDAEREQLDSDDLQERQAAVRSGFRRRLVETAGVVATSDTELGASLVIRSRDLEIPKKVTEHLDKLREDWALGEEVFEDTFSMWRAARQLASGFYYYWDWPGGIPDHEWLQARKEWHQEIREFLTHSARPGCDSTMLYARAVSNGTLTSQTYARWKEVSERNAPPKMARWIDDFVVTDALHWITKEKETGVIWYEHVALGEAIFARLKKENVDVEFCGPGSGARMIEASKQKRNLVASIHAHKLGKNLQMYARCLTTSFPGNGKDAEQLLGRLHRSGQEADEVLNDVHLHTPELMASFDQACEDAVYQEQTTGSKQKLVYGTKLITELKEDWRKQKVVGKLRRDGQTQEK